MDRKHTGASIGLWHCLCRLNKYENVVIFPQNNAACNGLILVKHVVKRYWKKIDKILAADALVPYGTYPSISLVFTWPYQLHVIMIKRNIWLGLSGNKSMFNGEIKIIDTKTAWAPQNHPNIFSLLGLNFQSNNSDEAWMLNIIYEASILYPNSIHIWRCTIPHWTLFLLTQWGRVMHICIGKLTIIGSDNGLSPDQCQAII